MSRITVAFPLRAGSSLKAVRRPRVMLFTDGFACGGTEWQFLQTVNGLDAAKYDVLIGCIRQSGPLLSVAQQLHLPIVEFPLRSLHKLHTLRQFCVLCRLLRNEKIDMLHAFGFVGDIFALPAAAAARVPATISSVRFLPNSLPRFSQCLLRASCWLSDVVICNSFCAATMINKSARTIVVRNVINIEGFQSSTSVVALRKQLGLNR